MYLLKSLCAAALTGACLVAAQNSASNVAAALEQLAFRSYAIRPLVQSITTANVEQTLIGQGPVVESVNLQGQMVATVIANIAALNGTTPFLDSTSEFAIAQSYSDFVQGLLELCDAWTAAAALVTLTDPVTTTMVYGSMMTVQAAVDGYLFYIMCVNPTDPDSATQKNRLDNHIVQAATAWKLISQPLANIPAYGSLANTTTSTNSSSILPNALTGSTLSTLYTSTSTSTSTSVAVATTPKTTTTTTSPYSRSTTTTSRRNRTYG